MKAAILAVGSELLGADRMDTNSLRLTEVLERHGVALVRKGVVGDEEEILAEEVRRLLQDHDLVILTGGLGPTADDVTREAVAKALGRRLVFCQEIADQIAGRFREFGYEMPEVNRRQAQVIEGAEVIPNRRGTAPGMRLEVDGCVLFLFPGVPAELEGMIESHLEPWLARRSGDRGKEVWTLKIASLPESVVEERLAPAYQEFGREAISVLARPGEIRVRIAATGTEEERRVILEAMGKRIAALLEDRVYAFREEETLEEVVGGLLRRSRSTLATAESCTGGMLAQRITEVAGSSDYFLGGVVSYANEVKIQLLDLPPELIETHGAVSEEVARAMAREVRRALKSDYGIGITGIAGPGGGNSEKPVGTVHLALAGPGPEEVDHRRVRFPGDREAVRWQACQLALEMLRRRLLGVAENEAERTAGAGRSS